jgi:hypothetical protein
LIEFVQATMPLRAGLFGGGVMPAYGPPDAALPTPEPDQELPDSNIDEWEQRNAIARESSRRRLEERS